MKSRVIRSVLAAFGFLAATGAIARPIPVEDMGEVLRPLVRSGAYVEEFVAGGMKILRGADPDGDGLTEAKIQFAERAAAAVGRAGSVAFILRFDLDANGEVTRGEVEDAVYSPEMSVEQRDRQVARVMKLDGDGDGIVTFDEMRTPRADGPVPRAGEAARLRALMAADPNDDGRLELDEFKQVLTQVFALIDTDGNSRIDPPEMEVFQKRVRPQVNRRPPVVSEEHCTLPRPSADDLVVALGAGRGTLFSAVSVGGTDRITTASPVVIDPGDEPIYLVLSSASPVIWQIEGDIERLSRVVVISAQASAKGESLGGVTGIPAGKVVFAGLPGCRPLLRAAVTINGAVERARLLEGLGREADVLAVGRLADVIRVPGGIQRPPSAWPALDYMAALDWNKAMTTYPEAMAEIDEKAIVSPHPVEPYDVLPEAMGLARLVADGALAPLPEGDGFRVEKPLARLPPGLDRYSGIRFVLADGIPPPGGRFNRFCVTSEPTGEAVEGSGRCPRPR